MWQSPFSGRDRRYFKPTSGIEPLLLTYQVSVLPLSPGGHTRTRAAVPRRHSQASASSDEFRARPASVLVDSEEQSVGTAGFEPALTRFQSGDVDQATPRPVVLHIAVRESSPVPWELLGLSLEATQDAVPYTNSEGRTDLGSSVLSAESGTRTRKTFRSPGSKPGAFTISPPRRVPASAPSGSRTRTTFRSHGSQPCSSTNSDMDAKRWLFPIQLGSTGWVPAISPCVVPAQGFEPWNSERSALQTPCFVHLHRRANSLRRLPRTRISLATRSRDELHLLPPLSPPTALPWRRLR